MKVDKRIVLACVAAFAIGFFVSRMDGGVPNPFVPQRPDRPVLAFVARVAKTFLWVAMFAEGRPPEPTYRDHAHVGPDGHYVLNHGEGW